MRADAGNAAMAGTYVLDRARSGDLNRDVERIVSRMNFVIRPMARVRLRRTNQTYERIAVAFGGGNISITLDQCSALVTPANGTTVDWTREDGDRLKVSSEWQNGTLEQRFSAEDGQRLNRFSLSLDGQVLTLDVTVTSSRLPHPFDYKRVYTRAR